MDDDKLRVLQEVNYTIPRSCNFCIYARLKIGSNWGTCLLHSYRHNKHNEPISDLSINRFGSCEFFEPQSAKLLELGSFNQFASLD